MSSISEIRDSLPLPAINKDVFAKRSPLIAQVPVHNLTTLATLIDEVNVSYVGSGARGNVFRLRNMIEGIDCTIKLIRSYHPFVMSMLQQLCEASLETVDQETISRIEFQNPHIVTAHQVKGHLLGHQITPDYIDAPLALWVVSNTAGSYEYVGYSLPFVDGIPIKICDDPNLMRIADEIEDKSIVYVGNRGEINASQNAVVNPDSGIKKFIDVKVRNKRRLAIQ